MRLTVRTGALLFAIEGLLFIFLACALLDRRAHQRDVIYGVNQWGYRDDAHASKEAGERRIAILGGSSAFEHGMPYPRTLAGQLYIELRQAGAAAGQIYSVVNLSEPRAGADSYIETLRGYRYLRPDVVCIFDGYDVLAGAPPRGRRQSLVFRAIGYLPMLPARLLGRPAWLSDPDGGLAEVLRAGETTPETITCAGALRSHCEAIAATVEFAIKQGYSAVVVSPPSMSPRHAQLEQSLAGLLDRSFGRDRRFTYLDLGRAMDLSDPVHSTDGLHRTEIGNHVIGQKMASAILRLRGGRGRGREIGRSKEVRK